MDTEKIMEQCLSVLEVVTETVAEIKQQHDTKTKECVDLLKQVKEPITRYEKFLQAKVNEPQEVKTFNIFPSLFKGQGKEIYHSRILGRLLEEKYILKSFLKTIYDEKTSLNISEIDFWDAEVLVESDNIDILIKSKSRSAIIIENKLRGASDEPRQLPRYLEKAEDKGYETRAIVYLPHAEKEPDDTQWNEDDKNKVKPLLCVLTPEKLSECLYQATRHCSDLHVISVVKQYTQLIYQQTQKDMNEELQDQFFKKLETKEQVKHAWRVHQIMKDFQGHLAKKVDVQIYNAAGGIKKRTTEDKSVFWTNWRMCWIELQVRYNYDAGEYNSSMHIYNELHHVWKKPPALITKLQDIINNYLPNEECACPGDAVVFQSIPFENSFAETEKKAITHTKKILNGITQFLKEMADETRKIDNWRLGEEIDKLNVKFNNPHMVCYGEKSGVPVIVDVIPDPEGFEVSVWPEPNKEDELVNKLKETVSPDGWEIKSGHWQEEQRRRVKHFPKDSPEEVKSFIKSFFK